MLQGAWLSNPLASSSSFFPQLFIERKGPAPPLPLLPFSTVYCDIERLPTVQYAGGSSFSLFLESFAGGREGGREAAGDSLASSLYLYYYTIASPLFLRLCVRGAFLSCHCFYYLTNTFILLLSVSHQV